MAMKFADGEKQALARLASQADLFFTEAPERAAKEMWERFCTERNFISSNARAGGFTGKVESMLRSPEFEARLRHVLKIAQDYGKNPHKALSGADGLILLNFRVNFNAILNDAVLRKVLVKCADGSELKELAKQFISDATVKAGFDRVTYLVHPEEKFQRTWRALWELKSFL